MAALLAWLAALPALGAASSGLRGPAAGRALQQMNEAWWMPPKPADKSCLMYYPAGCNNIRDQGTCVRSKDGRDRVAWNGLKIYAEPCVWCGGRPCTNNNTNLCEPYDFLFHGEGIGFTSFPNKTGFQVSQCTQNKAAPVSAPAVKPAACSAYQACAAQGLAGSCCPTPTNTTLACCASGLLASAVASATSAASTSEALGAAPTDFAEPAAVAPLVPVAPMKLPTVNDTWWQTPQPTSEAQTSCLMNHLFGCNVIVHRETCLGSKDGRENASWYGLKVSGQPCVWCGGFPCRSGSTNLCEPLDFLMRGEGNAFHSFFAKSTYQAATCVDGKPAPAENIFRHAPYPTMAPLPTLSPWWAPERPAESQLTCLKEEPQGCNAIQDMANCVSSRDGRPQTTMSSLKIHGEPCVWCGGSTCHSNASSLCEPFDYLMHGQGSAFGLLYATSGFTVANCEEKEHPHTLPDTYDTSCLEAVTGGCSALHDATSCLSMKDNRPQDELAGLKVHGQPCVWCGGIHCTDANAHTCEPYDFLVNGRGRAYSNFYGRNIYRVAGCKNGRPSAATSRSYTDIIPGFTPDLGSPAPLVPFWVAHKPTAEETKCLKPVPSGCRSLKTMETCMTSIDASGVSTIMGLSIDGEPCVWCGGGPCTTNSSNVCEPFGYAMYGEGTAYNSFLAKGIYKVAECMGSPVKLPAYDYACLAETGAGGCNSAWDAETCLKSKDGSSVDSVGDLQVRGQPCVWCGGGACHSGKNALCEAFDYALNGESTAFATFHASDTFRLAACKNGKPQAATLTNFTDFVPGWTGRPKVPVYNASWWKTPPPAEGDTACLMNHRFGCDKIAHHLTCLGSKDGRSQALFGPSIKVEGQPCVWCGGGPCISGSTSLCQPYDLVMNGEGNNFTTFFAKNHYQVASCKGDHPQPPMKHIPTTAPVAYVPMAHYNPYNPFGFEPLPAAQSSESSAQLPALPAALPALPVVPGAEEAVASVAAQAADAGEAASAAASAAAAAAGAAAGAAIGTAADAASNAADDAAAGTMSLSVSDDAMPPPAPASAEGSDASASSASVPVAGVATTGSLAPGIAAPPAPVTAGALAPVNLPAAGATPASAVGVQSSGVDPATLAGGASGAGTAASSTAREAVIPSGSQESSAAAADVHVPPPAGWTPTTRGILSLPTLPPLSIPTLAPPSFPTLAPPASGAEGSQSTGTAATGPTGTPATASAGTAATQSAGTPATESAGTAATASAWAAATGSAAAAATESAAAAAPAGAAATPSTRAAATPSAAAEETQSAGTASPSSAGAAAPSSAGTADSQPAGTVAAPSVGTLAPLSLPTVAPPSSGAADSSSANTADASSAGAAAATAVAGAAATVVAGTAATVPSGTAAPSSAGAAATASAGAAASAPSGAAAPAAAGAAAPAAFGTMAPLPSVTASPAASGAAPPLASVTFAPAASGSAAPLASVTAAPGAAAAESASAAAPATIAPRAPGTLGPLTLPPVTLGPLTLPPMPPMLGPLTLPPARPSNAVPDDAPFDCWVRCGHAGFCSYCGSGMACCRKGFASDPSECNGASGYDEKWFYHQCVKTDATTTAALSTSTFAPDTTAPTTTYVLVPFTLPPVATVPPVTTVAPVGAATSAPAAAATSASGWAVRDGGVDVPTQHDMTTAEPLPAQMLPGAGINFRNDTGNETNGTVIAAGHSSSGNNAWIWAILGVTLLACICLVPWLMGFFGDGKRDYKRMSKKTKRSGRTSSDLEGQQMGGSFASGASEIEMRQPLVRPEPDVFDQIDRNHDGVISQQEFAAAMGVPAVPMATAVSTVPAGVMATRVSMVPAGVMAVPVATTAVQQTFSMLVAAEPVMRPGMAAPQYGRMLIPGRPM